MDASLALSGIWIFGVVLKLTGFLVRDELRLRLLVGTGLASDIAFYGLRAEPVLPAVVSSLLMVSINVALIALIVSERTTWRMVADDRHLFSRFPTLTPGQFRRLRRVMVRTSEQAGTQLAWEGRPLEDLMLVFADRIVIAKNGAAFPIAGPSFVGEIAFLTGNPSSADVTLPDGGTVVRIPVAALKAEMTRKPALANAIIALCGAELARKVADSVPMDRAARSRVAGAQAGAAASATAPMGGA